MTESLLKRLSALHELALQGEGGEQANAERMFHSTLEANGLTEADFLEAANRPLAIRYQNAQERDLLFLFFMHQLGWKSTVVLQSKEKKTLITDAPPYQHKALIGKWKALRSNWKRARKRALSAFVVAHNLQAPADMAPEPEEPFDPAEAQRLVLLARLTERVPLNEQLNN